MDVDKQTECEKLGFVWSYLPSSPPPHGNDDDDKVETVRKRLEVYQSQTRPLVAYYAKWSASGDANAPRCRKIDGTGTVDQITARALAALV